MFKYSGNSVAFWQKFTIFAYKSYKEEQMKDLNRLKVEPLHLSQRIVEENNYFAVVTINVKVNKELEALKQKQLT